VNHSDKRTSLIRKVTTLKFLIRQWKHSLRQGEPYQESESKSDVIDKSTPAKLHLPINLFLR
jgi:hypothetical protein